MPFSALQAAPHIEALARYYRTVRAPDLATASAQAWQLLQQTGLEQLRQAAERASRVQAWPVEDPATDFPAPAELGPYRVLASDGSSDLAGGHFPTPYVVIHISRVDMAYQPGQCEIDHQLQFLYREEDLQLRLGDSDEETLRVDSPVVDTMRAFAELEILWEAVEGMPVDPPGRPLLAMMDAIVLWTHKGISNSKVHNRFRDEYLVRSTDLLARFQRSGVPLFSVTALPHHREVIYTLLACYCPVIAAGRRCDGCDQATDECQALLGLQDQYLFQSLPVGARSALFQPMFQGNPRWRLTTEKAIDPRLAFFYLQTAGGILRIEVPLWVWEAGQLDMVQAVVLDQGRAVRADALGYPVALSLAHDEAILTTGDRRMLQVMVEEALARQGVHLAPSPKAAAKRQ